jgi:membrane-associated phospholipid phosphatase
VLERLALTVGLITFFIAGYFGLGSSTNPARARELTSSLDKQIPFVARSVWVYLMIFPSALVPLFVVRCPRLFRRTALAYATAIAVSLICFIAFPVTSARLRVAPDLLDMAHPSDWAVSVLYSLDPPYNLFPSLHLSIAALAAFSAWKAARVFGAVVFVTVGFIAVSVCTVKQHILLDVLGGLALAALAGAVILCPYRRKGGLNPAYSWRGPALFLIFLILVYAGYYVAYLWSS